MSKGGKLCLQTHGRVKIKEENSFGPTHINNFWIIDPFAAKTFQGSCFSNTRYSTHFYVQKKKKKIEEG